MSLFVIYGIQLLTIFMTLYVFLKDLRIDKTQFHAFSVEGDSYDK